MAASNAIQQPENATENPSTPVYGFCDPITGKLVLPELNDKNEPEAQKSFKHILDLSNSSIPPVYKFNQMFLARGYRGSDPLVQFCRAFMTAAHKNIKLATSMALTLLNHGWRLNLENKAMFQEMRAKYRVLMRYAIFF